MKARPVLFSVAMVREILADRKGVTRRVVRLPEGAFVQHIDGVPHETSIFGFKRLVCPYGQPGDRLWVREAWCSAFGSFGGGRGFGVILRADGAQVRTHEQKPSCAGPFFNADMFARGDDIGIKWKPSIHMPRWASRLTLEVTSVRAEPLQDITEDDARAEGVTPLGDCLAAEQRIPGDACKRTHGTHPHTLAFAVLWDTINGDRGDAFTWAKNPWVWRVGFRLLEQPAARELAS